MFGLTRAAARPTAERAEADRNMSFSSTLILGVNGGFGRLFYEHLSRPGVRVGGVDLGPAPAACVSPSRYIRADATVPSAEASAALKEADCVIVCLPEAAALAAVAPLLERLSSGALLVDTLSVKTEYLGRLRGARRDFECLSINPMFAPDIGFRGQNVAAIEARGGPACGRFVSMMRGWGAAVTTMKAEEHDRLTAFTQVATHAALIAFGSALYSGGYDTSAALKIATPPHRLLLSLLARILLADPEVYWEIQHRNPLAGEVREGLRRGLSELEEAGASQTSAEFARMLKGIRGALGPEAEALAEHASKVLRCGDDKRRGDSDD